MDRWKIGVLVLSHHMSPSIDWYASVHTDETWGKTRQSRYLTSQTKMVINGKCQMTTI